MQPQTAWATGFLTQLILRYLRKRYPVQTEKINPRQFFSVIEGADHLKNPEGLLNDRHAYLPEEVLREVMVTAERISGRKDVAYHAALDYFRSASEERGERSPSLFEIIARISNDVQSVALFSDIWAAAYTTFLKLQPLIKEPGRSELVILSQCPEEFHPLIAMHHMLKGNYEGFVQLYDFVEEASLESEFLQYRINEIVGEFAGYQVENGRDVRILDVKTRQPVVVFKPVLLETERIPAFSGQGTPFSDPGAASRLDGAILRPEESDNGEGPAFPVLTAAGARVSTRTEASNALRVVRGGTLKSGPLTHDFREGDIYQAPYSRYRFRWRERGREADGREAVGDRLNEIAHLLFEHLGDLRATQQRMLAYAMENKALTTENIFLRQEVGGGVEAGKFMVDCSGLQATLGVVEQIAPSDGTVLITGETGTGKELIARLIHDRSFRRESRFVAINCGAVPEGLLESELFGHEKGAFSGAVGRRLGRFELAHEGTLFLDEIGDVSPAMQVKLLRVLQEQSFERVGGERTIRVNVRIIAATNRDLQELVTEGKFRKDLYYRLNVLPVSIPPLRERQEDIPLLAEFFLRKFAARLRKRLRQLAPEAMATLKSYGWPGNVRELENIMERVVTLAPADQTLLTAELLPGELRNGSGKSNGGRVMDDWIERMDWNDLQEMVSSEGSMDSVLRKIEWCMAKRAIRMYGNKSQAARALKRTYRWIRKLEKQMDSPLPE
jgi:transcriptional regulator with GAF, ATPase, and Fis domain